MVNFHRKTALLIFMCAAVLSGTPGHAAETVSVATLKMSSENSGIVFGWHDGTGVLTLQDGSEYEITMDAYSLLGFGFGKATLTGKIYNLANASDFPGVYSSTGTSSSFREGDGEITFTNDKKVRMELVSKESGYRAGLNFGSATFKLGKRLKGPVAPAPVAKAAPATPVKVTPLPGINKAVVKKTAAVETVAIQPTQFTLNFGFNKSRVNLAMGKTLDSVIRDWKDKKAVFHIIGHADRVGGEKYNNRLSQKRADAVKNALRARGVPGDKIVAVGVGNTVPAVATQKGQRLRANRRVVLTVLTHK